MWIITRVFLGLLVAVLPHKQGIRGLRIVRMDVPAAIMLGEAVQLNCSFDMETDELYSVKWYKNNVEFYRYLPSDNPPAQIYEAEGVHVDLSKTKMSSIYLNRTTINTDGVFRCEVSADAPLFQTVRKERELNVYAYSREGPIISSHHSLYDVGDRILATCSTKPSKPLPTLTWYINGKEAPLEFLTYHEAIIDDSGLQIASLGINFVAQPVHFHHGPIKLRCTATISQAYSISTDEIVIGEHAPVTVYTKDNDEDGPVITGGLPHYFPGDIVLINCTSRISIPPADLEWYINDKQAAPEQHVHYPRKRFPDGKESSVIGLKFTVEKSHFIRNEMRLKCRSTLSEVISFSSEKIIMSRDQFRSGLQVPENVSSLRGSGASRIFPFISLLCAPLLTATILL